MRWDFTRGNMHAPLLGSSIEPPGLSRTPKAVARQPEIEVCGDPIYGTRRYDLERVTAGLLAFAQREGLDAVIFAYCENQILGVTGEERYELAPPPAPVTVDLLRILTKSLAQVGQFRVNISVFGGARGDLVRELLTTFDISNTPLGFAQAGG